MRPKGQSPKDRSTDRLPWSIERVFCIAPTMEHKEARVLSTNSDAFNLFGCTTSRRERFTCFYSAREIDKSPRLSMFPSSFVNFILTFGVIPLSMASLTKKKQRKPRFRRCRLVHEHETISIERFRKFWHCRPCFVTLMNSTRMILVIELSERNETLNLNWNFMKCSTPIPHLRSATPNRSISAFGIDF